MSQGQVCGRLAAEQRGLYVVYYGTMRNTEVCRIKGIYEQGEIWLGVPVPENGAMVLRVSVPVSKVPKGNFLYGSVVLSEGQWKPWPGGRVGTLDLPQGQRKGMTYRFSWKGGHRLPCEELLCFYRYLSQGFLEVEFDKAGNPVNIADGFEEE